MNIVLRSCLTARMYNRKSATRFPTKTGEKRQGNQCTFPRSPAAAPAHTSARILSVVVRLSGPGVRRSDVCSQPSSNQRVCHKVSYYRMCTCSSCVCAGCGRGLSSRRPVGSLASKAVMSASPADKPSPPRPVIMKYLAQIEFIINYGRSAVPPSNKHTHLQ